jgi:hypothetical protein
MKLEELVEKLPEVLNRLEGKGPGSRSGSKVDPVEDLKVFASFLEFASEQARASGELFMALPSAAPGGAQSAPVVPSDEVMYDRARALVGNGLESPKLVASRDIPLEDAGKTNRVVGGLEIEPVGKEARRYDAAPSAARAPVTIPLPDDPQNISEWLPLIMWGLPKLQKLIGKIRGK